MLHHNNFNLIRELLEGGNATQEQGTERVNKSDIEFVIGKISQILDLPTDQVRDNLVGSAPLVLDGSKEDCGDIDFIVVGDTQKMIQQFTDGLSTTPKKIGNSIYAFVVETNGKKVQLDVMFVVSYDWGKFTYHADPESKYKSGVRNEFIHAILRNTLQAGKDLHVKSPEGHLIAKVARSMNLSSGSKRVFKKASPRQDGEGFVKELNHVNPDDIKSLLSEYGINKTFSEDSEEITDPDEFAKLLFGEGVTAQMMSSTEKIIELIRTKLPNKAQRIFDDAKKGILKRNFEIPEEIAN